MFYRRFPTFAADFMSDFKVTGKTPAVNGILLVFYGPACVLTTCIDGAENDLHRTYHSLFEF